MILNLNKPFGAFIKESLRGIEIRSALLLAAVMLVSGFVLPWWSLSVAAFVYAVFFNRGWRIHLEVVIAAKLAWLIPIAIQDGLIGFRGSAKIAGLLGLPGGIFAYGLTVWFGCLTAFLGSLAGANLRYALPPHVVSKLRQAGRQAD
jgi:hypothetical protein